MPPQYLHGWRDIASYLGRSVRAAQRWEKQLGLPVHRLPTQAGYAIYAIPSELDAWRHETERRHGKALQDDDDEDIDGPAGVADARGHRADDFDGHDGQRRTTRPVPMRRRPRLRGRCIRWRGRVSWAAGGRAGRSSGRDADGRSLRVRGRDADERLGDCGRSIERLAPGALRCGAMAGAGCRQPQQRPEPIRGASGCADAVSRVRCRRSNPVRASDRRKLVWHVHHWHVRRTRDRLRRRWQGGLAATTRSVAEPRGGDRSDRVAGTGAGIGRRLPARPAPTRARSSRPWSSGAVASRFATGPGHKTPPRTSATTARSTD